MHSDERDGPSRGDDPDATENQPDTLAGGEFHDQLSDAQHDADIAVEGDSDESAAG